MGKFTYYGKPKGGGKKPDFLAVSTQYAKEKIKEIEDENELKYQTLVKPKIAALKGTDREIWKTSLPDWTLGDLLDLYKTYGAPPVDNSKLVGYLMRRYPNVKPTFRSKTYETYREYAADAYNMDLKRSEIYGQYIFDVLYNLKKNLYEKKPLDRSNALYLLILQGIDKQYEARTMLHPDKKNPTKMTSKNPYISTIQPVKERSQLEDAILEAEIDAINKEIEKIEIDKATPQMKKVTKGEDYNKLTKPVIIAKIKELDSSQKNLAAKKKQDLISLLESLL